VGKPVPAHFNQSIEKLCRRFGILRDEFGDFFFGASSVGFEGLMKPANDDSLTWDLCRAVLSREKEKRIKGEIAKAAASPLWVPRDIYLAADAFKSGAS